MADLKDNNGAPPLNDKFRQLAETAAKVFDTAISLDFGIYDYVNLLCEVFDDVNYGEGGAQFQQALLLCQKGIAVLKAKKPEKGGDLYTSVLAVLELYELHFTQRTTIGNREQRCHDMKHALKRINPKLITAERLRECRIIVGFSVDHMINRVNNEVTTEKKWIEYVLDSLLPKTENFNLGELKIYIRMYRHKAYRGDPVAVMKLMAIIKKYIKTESIDEEIALSSASVGAFFRDAKEPQKAIEFYNIAIERNFSEEFLSHPPTVWRNNQLFQLVFLAESLCERVKIKEYNVDSSPAELKQAIDDLARAQKCIQQAGMQRYNVPSYALALLTTMTKHIGAIHNVKLEGHFLKAELERAPELYLRFGASDKKEKKEAKKQESHLPVVRKPVAPTENKQVQKKLTPEEIAAAQIRSDITRLEGRLANPDTAMNAKTIITDIQKLKQNSDSKLIDREHQKFCRIGSFKFLKVLHQQGKLTDKQYRKSLNTRLKNTNAALSALREELSKLTPVVTKTHKKAKRRRVQPDLTAQSNLSEVKKTAAIVKTDPPKVVPVKVDIAPAPTPQSAAQSAETAQPKERKRAPATAAVAPVLTLFDYKNLKNPIDMISSDVRVTQIGVADFSFIEFDDEKKENKKAAKQEAKKIPIVAKGIFFISNSLVADIFNPDWAPSSWREDPKFSQLQKGVGDIFNPGWAPSSWREEPQFNQLRKGLAPVGTFRRGLELNGLFSPQAYCSPVVRPLDSKKVVHPLPPGRGPAVRRWRSA